MTPETEPFPWCAPVRVASPTVERRVTSDWMEIGAADGNTVRLNPSALAVWRLCQEGATPADMVARLRLLVDDGQHHAVADDVQQALKSLLEAGLVKKPSRLAAAVHLEPISVEIISLKQNEARRRHVLTQTVPWLLHSPSRRFSPRIFDAVDGSDRSSVARALDELDVTVLPDFEHEGRPGQVGCYLSHLLVLRRLLDEGFSSAAVLEDDAGLHDADFGCVLGSIMADLHDLDWDIVYLYIFDDHFDAHRHDENIRIPGKTHIVRPYFTWCTIAYLVSRSGAEKILSGSRTLTQEIDLRLQEMIEARELKAFYTRRQFVVNRGQKTRDRPPEAHEFVSTVWP